MPEQENNQFEIFVSQLSDKEFQEFMELAIFDIQDMNAVNEDYDRGEG